MRKFTIRDKEQINPHIQVEVDTNHSGGFSDPVVCLNFEFETDNLILTLEDLEKMISKIKKIAKEEEIIFDKNTANLYKAVSR